MPETLANKIAAGEVVQRPASAAKELIENAIDAGADQITVILKDAGSSLIQVIDNGSGMSPTDAASCFQRHATSKITSIDDLEHIRTLGFRGEALASIAAVARLELRTKRLSDEVGSCVRIDGGERKSVTPCMTQNGTSVSVYNLFHKEKAKHCPGESCDLTKEKVDIQKINYMQITVLAIFLAGITLGPGVGSKIKAHLFPLNTEKDCTVPQFAIDMGHEEKWKLHNGCK